MERTSKIGERVRSSIYKSLEDKKHCRVNI